MYIRPLEPSEGGRGDTIISPYKVLPPLGEDHTAFNRPRCIVYIGYLQGSLGVSISFVGEALCSYVEARVHRDPLILVEQ
jgi:hypothetical protein